MASINIAGDTSGSISLTVPSVAGTNTVTIPANSGVVMVSGNMPAFSAYPTQNTQTISTGVETTVVYQNKFFDTASCYNTSTGVFTPNVAGYYQLSYGVYYYSAITTGEVYCYVMKNGGGSAAGVMGYDTTGSTYFYGQSCSIIVYANGTTDNFQIRTGQATGSSKNISNQGYFTGCLLRTA